tara:strand:- start:88 stop:555 length:468 start_codon:yes stop_codon:yes gene_type:complete
MQKLFENWRKHLNEYEEGSPQAVTRQILNLLSNGVLFVSNLATLKNSNEIEAVQQELQNLEEKFKPQESITKATELAKAASELAQTSANQPLKIAAAALVEEVKESQAVYEMLQKMDINNEASRKNALERAYSLAVRQEKRYKQVQDRATKNREE